MKALLLAATLAVRAMAIVAVIWIAAHVMTHYEVRITLTPKTQTIQPAQTLENISA